jgi:hypothetical protein
MDMDATPTEQQKDEHLAGDLMVGGDPILRFLIDLGILPADASIDDLYYLRRTRRWPIGKETSGKGGKLIASKRRLARHAQKIAAG